MDDIKISFDFTYNNIQSAVPVYHVMTLYVNSNKKPVVAMTIFLNFLIYHATLLVSQSPTLLNMEIQFAIYFLAAIESHQNIHFQTDIRTVSMSRGKYWRENLVSM